MRGPERRKLTQRCLYQGVKLWVVSWASFTALVSADPFLSYTLLAALFLGSVSLVSGWRRRDFLVLGTPQGLLHVALAVLCAFLLMLLETSLGGLAGESPWWLESLGGINRFPLYVLALAYGPSAGLVAAGLFAAFTATGTLPSWPEAVLALELVVLGWFAIAPSPREHRWAGPFNASIAYFLAWATGGSALLQYLTEQGAQWATHVSYHEAAFLGVALSVISLFVLSPKTYHDLFPDSRIKPYQKEIVLPEPVTTSQIDPTPQPSRQQPRPSRQLKQTFVTSWLNELNDFENPFRKNEVRKLRLTPPPQAGTQLGAAQQTPSRKLRRLSDLDLSELRARPKRRKVKAAPLKTTPFARAERAPRGLEPLRKND